MKDLTPYLHPEYKESLGVVPEEKQETLSLKEIQQINAMMVAAYKEKAIHYAEGLVIENKNIRANNKNVSVRLYYPEQLKDWSHTAVMFIHGGAMVYGTPEMNDEISVEIVRRTGAVVVAPDYTLGCYEPYPAAVEDCYAALLWTAQEYHPNRLAIMGNSAGGGLCMSTALLARDRKTPQLDFIMPLCPMLDYRADSASNHQIEDPRVWNGIANRMFWDVYLRGIEGEIPSSASAFMEQDLRGLPPVYMAIGQLDPFRTETLEFAERLSQAGVLTELHLYPGVYHGFAGNAAVPATDVGRHYTFEYLDALKDALLK